MKCALDQVQWGADKDGEGTWDDEEGEVAGRGRKRRGTALEGVATGHFASGSLIVAFHFLTRAKKQKASFKNPCPKVGELCSLITHA